MIYFENRFQLLKLCIFIFKSHNSARKMNRKEENYRFESENEQKEEKKGKHRKKIKIWDEKWKIIFDSKIHQLHFSFHVRLKIVKNSFQMSIKKQLSISDSGSLSCHRLCELKSHFLLLQFLFGGKFWGRKNIRFNECHGFCGVFNRNWIIVVCFEGNKLNVSGIFGH